MWKVWDLADKCQDLLVLRHARDSPEIKDLETGILQHAQLAPDWPSNWPFNCSIIKRLYIDNLHFQPYGYNEINKVWLHAVCPLAAHVTASEH